MRRALRAAALVGVLSCVAACADKTALKVVVTSPDLAIPADVDRLEIRVVGDVTGMMSDDHFPLTTAWPQSLSVHPGHSESEGVVITVTGRKSTGPTDTTGAFVVRRVVRDMFVRGADRTVAVELRRDCRGVMCADGVDCLAGHCATVGDGGLPDSAYDGDIDGGPPDIGPPDIGPVDFGCMSPAACDDHVACTVDTCVMGGCVNTPNDARCAMGDTCDPVAGCGGRPCTMSSMCSDGNFCNGDETCVTTTMVCATGMSPTCDDGDPCTDGICMGTMPGACMQRTHDGDGDGHGPTTCTAVGGIPADDCNDLNALAFPGAPETCNGADDNCDGACDDGFACCRGMTGGCTTACGSTGTRVCDVSCAWGTCSPPAEVCNGMDDDCNGVCDDGVGCCAGSVAACTTTCGSSGTITCNGSCVSSGCVPPPETCNGVDDNCNGMIDEGFTCVAGSVAPCTTTCSTVGSQTCTATCAAGACIPPAEICGNGIDDNCVGGIDEGCMAGCTGVCPGATAVAAPGGRFTQALVPGLYTGSCGGAGGSEALFAFNTVSTSDVFITTHPTTGIDTVLYVRGCACAGTENGCNDDSDGATTSLLQLNSLAAGSYTIFVDTKMAMSAMVTVDIYISPTATAGDHCGHPLAFTRPSVSGSTCGLTSDNSGDCEYIGSLNGPDNVYYVLVTGAARSIVFDTTTGCTNYDSALELRRVCTPLGGVPDRVECNDDGGRSSCGVSGGPPPGQQSRFTNASSCTPATSATCPGSTILAPGFYYLFADGYGATCGNYVVTSTGL